MNQQLILLLVAMVAIFYLLIYRPQQRAKREKETLMRSLGVGVEVVTVGGIYGEVAALREEDLDLEVADGVVMRIDRRAIASIASAPVDDEDGEDEDDEEWEDDEDGEWEDDEDGEDGDEADAAADDSAGAEGATPADAEKPADPA